MNYRDLAERCFWTFVSTFIGALIGSAVLSLDVSALQSAALAGIGAVLTVVSAFARDRLAVLPSPGEGLPGLPAK